MFISKSILPRTVHKMSVSEQLHFYKEALPNHSDGNYFKEPHTDPRNCEWDHRDIITSCHGQILTLKAFVQTSHLVIL